MPDIKLLQMALIGYEAERRKIEEKMAEIRGQLGGRTHQIAASTDGARPVKRQMSAAARQRIGVAQRKRWAAFREDRKPALKAARKRRLSPAAKAKLVANLAKARAAKAAKKAAVA